MRRFGLLVLVVLGAAMAQVKVPDTPAGQWLRDFLEVYNRFDPQVYTRFTLERTDPQFVRELGGLEQAVKTLGSFYAIHGPLEVHSLGPQGPHALQAMTQGRLSKGWIGLEVNLDPANPLRVKQLSLELEGPPAGVKPIGPLGDAELASALQGYLTQLNQQGLFSGVVLVARQGTPIFQGSYGKRNLGGEPLSFDSKFALASLSKMFTALAIAQLVEAGKLSYQDLVSRHLSEYPAERIKEVTVHHLLSHTSGLGGFDFEEIAPMTTVREMLKLAVESTPYKVGERFSYSNMGFVLLGAIIEKVSGEDYYQYLNRHIFAPLGMTQTGGLALSEDTPGFATGFVPDLEGWYKTGKLVWQSNKGMRVSRGSPAGDLLSTAPDLLRFSSALRQGKLVRPETFNQMIAPKSQAPYGYGFQGFSGGLIGHSGGAPGQNTFLALDLKQGYTLIILSNQDRAASAVMRHISSLLGLSP